MNRRDLLKGFLGLPVAGVLAKVGLSLPPPEPEPEPDDLLTRDWDDDDGAVSIANLATDSVITTRIKDANVWLLRMGTPP